MRLALATATQFLLLVAMPYFVILVLVGVRSIRRRTGSLRAQEEAAARVEQDPDHPARTPLPAGYRLFMLVPCLNEQAVIGPNIDRLLDDADVEIVLVDDGSVDDTVAVARQAAQDRGESHRLQVVTRTPPHAREGKGMALNAGLAAVRERVGEVGGDPGRTIVCVLDADGRLSRGAAAGAVACFDDPHVGGVQLTVRIRNRHKWITRFQDLEFWMISACAQFARVGTGTVSLGGNGQFTRLSALDELGDRVWSQSLTEDLDLGLSLYVGGWDVITTGAGFVDQQGIERYRPLLRQRTRWYQGHMTCLRRVPQLWRSPRLSPIGLAEAISYLLVPWVIVLPWSILQQFLIYLTVTGVDTGIITGWQNAGWGRFAAFLLWYVLSFLPNIVIGLVYARRTAAVSFPTAMLLGHLMIFYNYVGYLSVWAALARMITGRRGWTKTARHHERPPGGRAPQPASPLPLGGTGV